MPSANSPDTANGNPSSVQLKDPTVSNSSLVAASKPDVVGAALSPIAPTVDKTKPTDPSAINTGTQTNQDVPLATSKPPPPTVSPPPVLLSDPSPVPPIKLPPTTLTPTTVPPTSVPPTTVPPTIVPLTTLPPTTLPPTLLPPTTLPPVSIPPVSIPPASQPSSTAPASGTNNGGGQVTNVGIWNLHPDEHTELSAPSNAEIIISVNTDADDSSMVETVIGYDDRKLVSKQDFMPGGKYRGIVKLFLRFAGQEDSTQPWAMATGWLIRPDLLVTAGHCAYDWSHDLGNLTHVKAYIGYAGQESVSDPDYAVQFRAGKSIATTSLWLSSGSNKPRDVSFIKLSSPFEGVTPFNFRSTPRSGSFSLGVVGYPGDLQKQKTGEKGACMYEMFLKTTFDISRSAYHMLEYVIDTFGGNSGSPVLRLDDLSSIGVHVYGGRTNSASIIDSSYGNFFSEYISALDAFQDSISTNSRIQIQQDTRRSWLYYAAVPSQPTTEESSFPDPDSLESSTEDFFSFLKDALSIGAPIAGTILQAGLPVVLGPVGAPVGALAGIALSIAGRLAQSSGQTESDIIGASKSYSFDGVVERAILGEAALSAVVHLGKAKCEAEGIFADMSDIVKKLMPVVKTVGPKILVGVTEPALRLVLDELRKSRMSGTEAAMPAMAVRDLGSFKIEANTLGFGRRLDQNGEDFVKGLTNSITQQDTESFLSVLETVGDVILKGLRVAAPIIQSVAVEGLARLAEDTEASIDSENATAYSFDGLGQRAIAGEAALQALMKVPADKVQAEGLFDVIMNVVTTLGPSVIQAAPGVISAVAPIVVNLLGKRSSTEADLSQGQLVPASSFLAESKFLYDLGSTEMIFKDDITIPKGTQAILVNNWYALDKADLRKMWITSPFATFIRLLKELSSPKGQKISGKLNSREYGIQDFGQQCFYFASDFYSLLIGASKINQGGNRGGELFRHPELVFGFGNSLTDLKAALQRDYGKQALDIQVAGAWNGADLSWLFLQAFEFGTVVLDPNPTGLFQTFTLHGDPNRSPQFTITTNAIAVTAILRFGMQNYLMRILGLGSPDPPIKIEELLGPGYLKLQTN